MLVNDKLCRIDSVDQSAYQSSEQDVDQGDIVGLLVSAVVDPKLGGLMNY